MSDKAVTTDPNTIPGEYESKDAHQAVAHIVEECGEVIAAAGKAFRFGPNSFNPELPSDQRETNIEWFAREVNDLERAIKAWRLMEIGNISKDIV